MKILYVTNHNSIAKASGGYISDYLNDLVFYGLYELFGTDVIDSTPIISLYSANKASVNESTLWGRFTSFWLIESDHVDRSDIVGKIESRFYDLIVYGSIKRCDDFYALASAIYDRKKIILIDGDDDASISHLYAKHPYFKRELQEKIPGVFPISFSIPGSKITNNTNRNKTRGFGSVAPGIDETYVFKSETGYYDDYNSSFFGITMKKDGWDCMRHYEILANYCMPYFIDLPMCPPETMVDFPRQHVLRSMKLFDKNKFESTEYFDILDEVFEYTKAHLTTKRTAEKLLEKIL